MGRKPQSDEAVEAMRARVIDAALAILARDGRAGLSARRLAADVGASTKVVYDYFGGMGGVVEAVYARCFSELETAMRAADDASQPPAKRVHAVMSAYRDYGLAMRDRFELMYGRPVATLAPTPRDRDAARGSLDVVADILEATGCSDPRAEAYRVWAALHGAVALEVTGWLEGPEVFEAVLDRMVLALRVRSASRE